MHGIYDTPSDLSPEYDYIIDLARLWLKPLETKLETEDRYDFLATDESPQ